MVYIICILPYEYYIGMIVYIMVMYMDICIYSCLGGWLGSLLLRIEPRGLYPWDIFSCLHGSIYHRY